MKKQPSQQNIPDKLLQELLRKNSAKKVKDFILEEPKQPWEHSTKGNNGTISFKVNFAGEESQQQHLKWLIREHQLFNTEQPLKGNMNVVMSLNNSRIEANGNNLHGENFIYITDKKNGFLFLDKTRQTYIHLPDDRKVNHHFRETLKGEVNINQNPKNKTATAEVIITAPYKIKYVLELDTDKKWSPFSHDITCMLIACTGKLDKAGLNLDTLIKTGVPVKGETYMEQSGGMWQKMSSFIVTDLRFYAEKNNPFDIPRGYRNLRDFNSSIKNEGKRTNLGPVIKLSDYRKKKDHSEFKPGEWPTEYSSHGKDYSKEPNENQTLYSKPGTTDGIEFPSCLPETYGARIANLIDEKLLDDLKFFINGVSKRLTEFNTDGTNLNIDWMNQFKAHADALSTTDPGGGLYDLLYDETPTDASYSQKLGLLDKLAVSTLGMLLADDDHLLNLSLSTSLQTAVDNLIADASISRQDRFSSLSAENQGLLVDAYIFNGIGNIQISYPSSTGTQTVFYGLLNVRIDENKLNLRINNTDIITAFEFDSDSIHLVINLPEASGEAWISRWPTLKYWGLVGIGVVSCFIFPFTCFLAGMAITVGLFIALDIVFLSLEIANLVVDGYIRLVANENNVLEPDIDLTLDADVSAFYLSVIPTTFHQILGLILNIVLNETGLLLDTVQSQLRIQLNNYLKKDLKLSYPPQFGPVTLDGIGNHVEFTPNDNGYAEQSLNAGLMGVINPYITQIDSEVKPNLLTLRDQFKADFADPVDEFNNIGLLSWAMNDLNNVARFYLGTVLSQNFVNDYVHTLWRQLSFNYDFNSDESGDLSTLLRTAFPDLNFLSNSAVTAHLWPAVSPRTLFTPKPASESNLYAMTFFDDIRICFELNHTNKELPQIMEFAFAGQVATEIGFGAYNSDIGKLDLLKLSDRSFDIYFDIRSTGVNIIHPEVQYFAFPGISPTVNFDYSPLNLLQEIFKRSLAYSLAKRDNTFIPRNTGEPIYIQRYPLGNDALQLVFQLVPFRGNLYISKGLSGKATAVYEGALDIDLMDKVMAHIIRFVV